MYYQFTGQPGHGKTVLALEFVWNLKRDHEKKQAKAEKAGKPVPPDRTLYICNVKDADYEKLGAVELTPDEVKRWHEDPNFDHAIILIDEAYEHEMFPSRSAAKTVPEHVKQVAKHRHRGIDFVMVCQSPAKQMDSFLHDLIEEHYHIRRRYGMPLVHVRRFDRFERNPEKATPLTIQRRKFPKKFFDFYTSTKFDTSEKRVPWFYYAAAALGLFVLLFGARTCSQVYGRFTDPVLPPPATQTAGGTGAPATGTQAGFGAGGQQVKWTNARHYVEHHEPRVHTMPWSAPAYDGHPLTAYPEVYCMHSPEGRMIRGEQHPESCSCLTEQGTRYPLQLHDCKRIAREGMPYNPYRREVGQGEMMMAEGGSGVGDGFVQRGGQSRPGPAVQGAVGTAPRPFVAPEFGTLTRPIH